MNDIKVSVVLITYNHEDTVGQAIESILMQKTNFNYEIIVAEDCSTDNTRNVLMEYKRKYPDKVRLLFRKRNVGVIRNIISAFNQVKGTYIALLEGDDYWNDEDKLQKQYNFLEYNTEYSACYSNAYVIDETGRDKCLLRTKDYDLINLEIFFRDVKYVPTASLFFRAYIIQNNNYYKYFGTKVTTDVILQVILIRHGMIRYFDEKMVTYRFVTRGGNSYSSRNREFIYYDSMVARRMQIKLIKGYRCSLIEKILTYRNAAICLGDKQIRMFTFYCKNCDKKKAAEFILKDVSFIEKFIMLYTYLVRRK